MSNENGVRKMRFYRERLRAQGLRPIQIWVPDSRAPEFKASLTRQIANFDSADDAAAMDFMEKVAESPADE